MSTPLLPWGSAGTLGFPITPRPPPIRPEPPDCNRGAPNPDASVGSNFSGEFAFPYSPGRTECEDMIDTRGCECVRVFFPFVLCAWRNREQRSSGPRTRQTNDNHRKQATTARTNCTSVLIGARRVYWCIGFAVTRQLKIRTKLGIAPIWSANTPQNAPRLLQQHPTVQQTHFGECLNHWGVFATGNLMAISTSVMLRKGRYATPPSYNVGPQRPQRTQNGVPSWPATQVNASQWCCSDIGQ